LESLYCKGKCDVQNERKRRGMDLGGLVQKTQVSKFGKDIIGGELKGRSIRQVGCFREARWVAFGQKKLVDEGFGGKRGKGVRQGVL